MEKRRKVEIYNSQYCLSVLCQSEGSGIERDLLRFETTSKGAGDWIVLIFLD